MKGTENTPLFINLMAAKFLKSSIFSKIESRTCHFFYPLLCLSNPEEKGGQDLTSFSGMLSGHFRTKAPGGAEISTRALGLKRMEVTPSCQPPPGSAQQMTTRWSSDFPSDGNVRTPKVMVPSTTISWPVCTELLRQKSYRLTRGINP